MDPVFKAVYFGKTDQHVRSSDPNEARQEIEPSNDLDIALRAYEKSESFENAQKVVLAYERVGDHEGANEFSRTCGFDLGPRFTV
jgi:hypothetical protein